MPTPAEFRATIDYYVGLLAIQYRAKPRARANIAIYVKQALGDMLAKDVEAAFDVATAVGAQLDVIGKYVGVSRQIGDPVPQPYYDFSDSTGINRFNGFQNSTVPAQNAQAIWYQSTFLGSNNTALSDDAYRFVIQLQIILNVNNGTLAAIQDYLHTFLPGLVALTDNANMTLTYTLSRRIPVTPAVLQRFLPKPMGVGIIFVTLEASLNATAIAKTVTSAAPFVTVTTDTQIVVTPLNGVGPFQYLWEYVSGPAVEAPVPLTPTAPATYFTMQLVPNPTDATSVYRCLVTDSRGLVAYSDNVTVHLKAQLPP